MEDNDAFCHIKEERTQITEQSFKEDTMLNKRSPFEESYKNQWCTLEDLPVARAIPLLRKLYPTATVENFLADPKPKWNHYESIYQWKLRQKELEITYSVAIHQDGMDDFASDEDPDYTIRDRIIHDSSEEKDKKQKKNPIELTKAQKISRTKLTHNGREIPMTPIERQWKSRGMPKKFLKTESEIKEEKLQKQKLQKEARFLRDQKRNHGKKWRRLESRKAGNT